MRTIANLRPFHLFYVCALSVLLFIAAGLLQAHASSAILEKYKKAAALYGIDIAYGEIEELGDGDFKVKDVVFSKEGTVDSSKISAITVKGVTELNGNGLSAELITFIGASASARDKDGNEIFITSSGGRFEGLYVPDPSDTEAPAFNFGNTKFEVSNVQLDIDGVKRLSMPKILSQTSVDDDSKLMNIEFNMNDINFFIENIEDEKAQKQFASFGIDELKLDVDFKGSWNREDGRIEVESYDFTAQDIATLGLQFAINGYSESLAKELRNESYIIQKLPVAEQGKASAQLMEKLANLTFESAKINFTDHSITDKLLTMQAKSSGQSEDELKMMVPFMISGTIGDIVPEAITNNITGAVKKFLANPGTISIAAKPDAPIVLGEMMALGAAVPAVLLDKLNIEAVAQ